MRYQNRFLRAVPRGLRIYHIGKQGDVHSAAAGKANEKGTEKSRVMELRSYREQRTASIKTR